jgi:SAM-dependent methyltransferase
VTSGDWDARYGAAELVWGVAPNRFVAAELAELPPGRALDVACGEGRNAIWLAERGWDVVGIDFSGVAIERARARSAELGVAVAFTVDDVLVAPLEARTFDLVLIAYLQLPPAERVVVLERSAAAVAADGTFLLVGHDRRNHAQGHGGPSDPSLLWTVDEVVAGVEAAGLRAERAEEVLREVEGAPRPAIDALVRAVRRP